MISIVCVYNNKYILKNYLIRSLKNQTGDYEAIFIDNTKGKFKSAAEALNYGGKRAKGEYIMFVHQDVYLCSNTWLEEAERVLNSLPNLGVAGVSGKKENGKFVLTSVIHGDPPTLAGEILIKKPTKVQTLDECLLIVPKHIFNILKFDESTCRGWHLYGVDYCLSVKKLGFEVYVLPLPTYHKSTGINKKRFIEIILSLEPHPTEYYQDLKKLLLKHRDVKKICTTCGDWTFNHPMLLQKLRNLISGGARFALRFILEKIYYKAVVNTHCYYWRDKIENSPSI